MLARLQSRSESLTARAAVAALEKQAEERRDAMKKEAALRLREAAQAEDVARRRMEGIKNQRTAEVRF